MSNNMQINTKFIHHLTLLIIEKKTKSIKEIITTLHAADVANIIAKLPIKEALFLFNIIEEKKSANILIELENKKRQDILSNLTPKEIAKDIIENLESDDAADLIGYLPKERKEKVLAHIEDIDYEDQFQIIESLYEKVICEN